MSDYLTLDNQPLDLAYTPGQMEIFFSGHPEQFTVVPKGRRFGATHGAAKFCIESMLDGLSILWVDTVQSNLDSYFNKYFLPELKKIKKEFWRYRQVQKDLRIVNTVLDFRSAERPENIEGFAYHIIIINEAGIVLKGQRGRNLWYNTIYPMVLDYNARVYFLGTPKGKKAKKDEAPAKTTLYYELALKGGLKDKGRPLTDEEIELIHQEEKDVSSDATPEALQDKYKKHENYRTLVFTSYDNPLLDADRIEELEKDTPRVVRKQEIGGEFIDIGDEEIFKLEWFADKIRYERAPVHLRGRRIMSLDTAFKTGAENDDSAGGVFEEFFIDKLQCWLWLDCFAEKLEFPDLIRRTKEFYYKWEPDLCLIEDKASGTPLIQTMKKQLPGIPLKAITPVTDKINRAVACTPWFYNGQVFLLFGAWNDMAVDQLCDFNALLDTPDDIVDMVSQLLNFVKGGGVYSSAPITRDRQVRRSSITEGMPVAPTSGRQKGKKSRYLEGYLNGK